METEDIRIEAEQAEERPVTSESDDKAEPTSPEPAEPGAQEKLELSSAALSRGQIVDGLIVHIDESGALVDVGTKSEGHIPSEELAGGTTDKGKPLEVGDRVAVYVVRPEDEDGSPVLSKKIADYERTWQRLTSAYEHGEVLSAMVTDRVRGGLVVDLGVRGFLPASHVQVRNVHALDRFLGQSIKVKIVEVDRARKRVVVSQRQAIEEERRRRREQTLASLTENRVCKGIVRRITNYGAFVDLGGIDGLLHITEMSWTRIGHPSEVLKVGDKIDVMVLRVDREQSRISLGLKQILPDPWERVKDELKVGQTVSCTVSRLVPSGAFVRLESGIEGIIPNSEMPGGRGQRPQDVLSVGQVVDAKVVNLRPSERRLALSLRLVEQAKERRELREYMERQRDTSRVTIGDIVGAVLTNAQVAHSDAQEQPQAGAAEADEGSGAEEPSSPATGESAEEPPAEEVKEAGAGESAGGDEATGAVEKGESSQDPG